MVDFARKKEKNLALCQEFIPNGGDIGSVHDICQFSIVAFFIETIHNVFLFHYFYN